MKSQRKLKNAETGLLANKVMSVEVLNDHSQEQEVFGDSDWLPSKELIKPEGQLQLDEKELGEEITRILNGNNPHAPHNVARFNHKEGIFKASPNVDHLVVHFEVVGYLIFKEEDEEPTEGEGMMLAAEMLDHPRRQKIPSEYFTDYSNKQSRMTNTEPPPRRVFSDVVNQFSIYDAYTEDLLQKEKLAKDKIKSKGQKDEDTKGLLPSEAHGEEVYYKNQEFGKAIIIIERMANQITFDDIAQDYKYWEDAADELGDKKGGNLLPLWKFVCEKNKKKQVTAVCWNPQSPDLFAVGYGSYDFSKQGPGIIACFTLKNPSHPEYVYYTDSGVLCLDFHPEKPSLIAAGLYDGSVMVFNLQKKGEVPIYKSLANKPGKHTDPVWQVSWQSDDLDDNANFYSVSSDGRVSQWTLLKNELVQTDVIRLTFDIPGGMAGSGEEKLFELSEGCCFDFHKKVDHLFVVGTEEGRIYKCSKAYNSEYLLTFEGHQMGVYTVRYNPFFYDVFLSASADWTVKLWDHNQSKPLMSFDLNAPVGDVGWAPYSSSVFAVATTDGKVFVFDLNENKNEPVCEQQIVKKAKLTHISFNKFEPILLVGDDRGNVSSLKLSPNLRKPNKNEEGESDKLQRILYVGSQNQLS